MKENNQSIDSLNNAMHEAFNKSASTNYTMPVEAAKVTGKVSQPWSPELVTSLAVGILLFTAFMLAVITFTMIHRKLSGAYSLKLYAIVLIISFSSFLCVTGYGQEQLASVFGLFGAIAGYVLGKDERRVAENNQNINDRLNEPVLEQASKDT